MKLATRERLAVWLIDRVVLALWHSDVTYGTGRPKSEREYRWEKRVWRWVAGWDVSAWP